jgi:hypothetical protein
MLGCIKRGSLPLIPGDICIAEKQLERIGSSASFEKLQNAFPVYQNINIVVKP